MRKLLTAIAVASMAFSTVAAAPAQTDPPEGMQFALELKAGEAVVHEGEAGGGGTTAGGLFFGLGPTDRYECGQDYTNYCDRGLLEVKSSGVVSYELTAGTDPADFDVFIYEADKDGTITNEEPVASSGTVYAPVAAVGIFAPTETGSFEAKKGSYYHIIVDYYAAGGGYTLDVSLA